MGLQNNQAEVDQGITVHPHIRDGGYHPHRNRDAHHLDRNSQGNKFRSRNQRPRQERRASGSDGYAHSIIPIEARKLAQSTCKVEYIQSRGVSLKKGL